MLNNLMHILFVPEVTLAILAVACLMYGLFSKNNSFNKATNFSTAPVMTRFFGGDFDGEWSQRGEMVFGYTHQGNLHSAEYKSSSL